MDFSNNDFSNYAKEPIDNPILPYHRCYRPMKNRMNSGSFTCMYLLDDDYAVKPYYYVRSFRQLQKEIMDLFLYVEPCDTNIVTYSYKIQQLFIRCCIDIEANFKAIFNENHYSVEEKKWTIKDYKKIDASHRLSEYVVTIPIWDGTKNVIKPFDEWKSSGILPWYQAYQDTKHNKAEKLSEANFGNLLNAFCGLFVVLSSQFYDEEYDTGAVGLSIGSQGSYYPGEFGIGGFLQIEYPHWDDNELYDVDWSIQCKCLEKFRKYNYDTVKFDGKGKILK